MENAIEERAEKCSAYDKKLFTKGRQTTYQDAITTISNIVVFLEFTPAFRNYAEKSESKIPWLTQTLVCQIQSVLNRFVDLASNWTSQRLIENEVTLPSSLLDNAFRTYEHIINNVEDTLNNSSNILFGVRPLSYVEVKTLSKRKSSNSPDGVTKRQNNGAITKGRIICTGGTFSFPENLSKQPCRNFVTENKYRLAKS